MSRLIILRVVVLPHPDGPTRAVRVPGGTSRLSSLTAAAVDPGKTLVTASSRMAASPATTGGRRYWKVTMVNVPYANNTPETL
jgi:hypothetical protein